MNEAKQEGKKKVIIEGRKDKNKEGKKERKKEGKVGRMDGWKDGIGRKEETVEGWT